MTQKAKKDTARELAIAMARLADDRNAENIIILDLRESSPVTDYFVIATGTSGRQLAALADEIEKVAKNDFSSKAFRVAGKETCDWIVIDFFDVVIHLFNRELRDYYDLELIWGEAKQVVWKRRTNTV